jgi:protein-tyrosine kinase
MLLAALFSSPVRSERELAAVLGAPLLATRPLRHESLRAVCEQLLAHWFIDGRSLLPVVSARRGEGRSELVAQLAVTFAALGVRTLLIDADLRSPAQHRRFGLPNDRGLADFLARREMQPAACGENLAVMVAGACGGDPLELLGREELAAFLAAAGKRFRVILIDTPAAARGPDLQIFAALAGGALVLAPRSCDRHTLGRLGASLRRSSARVVAALLSGE